jgi:hypothetical protein
MAAPEKVSLPAHLALLQPISHGAVSTPALGIVERQVGRLDQLSRPAVLRGLKARDPNAKRHIGACV